MRSRPIRREMVGEIWKMESTCLNLKLTYSMWLGKRTLRISLTASCFGSHNRYGAVNAPLRGYSKRKYTLRQR